MSLHLREEFLFPSRLWKQGEEGRDEEVLGKAALHIASPPHPLSLQPHPSPEGTFLGQTTLPNRGELEDLTPKEVILLFSHIFAPFHPPAAGCALQECRWQLWELLVISGKSVCLSLFFLLI